MGDSRLLERISLTNFLSFGPEGCSIDLRPLNVLIGPNASGKSNLIAAIQLLRNLPETEISGVTHILWNGVNDSQPATLGVDVRYSEGRKAVVLPYHITFRAKAELPWSFGGKLEICEEVIGPVCRSANESDQVYAFYHDTSKVMVLPRENRRTETQTRIPQSLDAKDFSRYSSVFHQLKDAVRYPEITYLSKQFHRARVYPGAFEILRSRYPRQPFPADASYGDNELLPEGDNLAAVLQTLQRDEQTRDSITEKLRRFDESVQEVFVEEAHGFLHLLLREKDLHSPVPATRIADGMLRYLCLLAILCHPNPPPLVCIEEPEIGLHPDALSAVAELLVEASRRTQLIVTTHSDILVSELSEVPESILVCERFPDGTRVERLEPDRLKYWLDKYSLGEIWMMGELGGTRW